MTDLYPHEILERIAQALERMADAITPAAHAITPQTADPAPDTAAPAAPAARGRALITQDGVAERYGVSPELVRRYLLNGNGVQGEDGRLYAAESDLPPLPEGRLASPGEAAQITGMTQRQLRELMHAGHLTGYQPFGIARYRYARAALLQYAAEEARRGR